MSKIVLTVAAHPDDEILGCGGAMARHAAEGDQVHILILAEGLTSRDDERNRESRQGELQGLARSADLAARAVGALSCELLDFPDNRMDSVDLLNVVKAIEKKIESIQPTVVYTHFPNDLNVDHRVTSHAVMTACRPVPGQVVKEIYFFEVLSSTEWAVGSQIFRPNVFVSLGQKNAAFLDAKMKALACYESEMRDFPHARSIEAIRTLAALRGASIGEQAAEAFEAARVVK